MYKQEIVNIMLKVFHRRKGILKLHSDFSWKYASLLKTSYLLSAVTLTHKSHRLEFLITYRSSTSRVA